MKVYLSYLKELVFPHKELLSEKDILTEQIIKSLDSFNYDEQNDIITNVILSVYQQREKIMLEEKEKVKRLYKSNFTLKNTLLHNVM